MIGDDRSRPVVNAKFGAVLADHVRHPRSRPSAIRELEQGRNIFGGFQCVGRDRLRVRRDGLAGNCDYQIRNRLLDDVAEHLLADALERLTNVLSQSPAALHDAVARALESDPTPLCAACPS